MRHYMVFNLEQAEGIKAPPSPVEIGRSFNPIQAAENLIEVMPQRPEIRHGGIQACYSPYFDYVNMPQEEAFNHEEGYYCTLFHELGHSTGHSSRLGRKGVMDNNKFASHEYSKEELVAEMTAAYLCAESGIEQSTLDNSAAYIQAWLKQLENDKSLVILAAGQAQKAYDFILNRQAFMEVYQAI